LVHSHKAEKRTTSKASPLLLVLAKYHVNGATPCSHKIVSLYLNKSSLYSHFAHHFGHRAATSGLQCCIMTTERGQRGGVTSNRRTERQRVDRSSWHRRRLQEERRRERQVIRERNHTRALRCAAEASNGVASDHQARPSTSVETHTTSSSPGLPPIQSNTSTTYLSITTAPPENLDVPIFSYDNIFSTRTYDSQNPPLVLAVAVDSERARHINELHPPSNISEVLVEALPAEQARPLTPLRTSVDPPTLPSNQTQTRATTTRPISLATCCQKKEYRSLAFVALILAILILIPLVLLTTGGNSAEQTIDSLPPPQSTPIFESESIQRTESPIWTDPSLLSCISWSPNFGVHISSSACDYSQDQYWAFNERTRQIIHAAYHDQCLEVLEEGQYFGASGNLKLTACNKDNPNQEFYTDETSRIHSVGLELSRVGEWCIQSLQHDGRRYLSTLTCDSRSNSFFHFSADFSEASLLSSQERPLLVPNSEPDFPLSCDLRDFTGDLHVDFWEPLCSNCDPRCMILRLGGRSGGHLSFSDHGCHSSWPKTRIGGFFYTSSDNNTAVYKEVGPTLPIAGCETSDGARRGIVRLSIDPSVQDVSVLAFEEVDTVCLYRFEISAPSCQTLLQAFFLDRTFGSLTVSTPRW